MALQPRRWFKHFFTTAPQPINRRTTRGQSIRPLLESLETRLAPADYRVTAQLQVLCTDGADATAAAPQVVFFESSVANYQVLEQGLAPDTDAVVLDSGGDGLREMAAFLQNRHGLLAIHMVSHGAAGTLNLGTTALDEASLLTDTADVKTLGHALAPHGDLMLWGCDVAAGPAGQTLLRDLAGATGANVAASAHLVGATALGGTWSLEATVGKVHTPAPFAPAARSAFATVLLWDTAPSVMVTPRQNQTATLLTRGKVLVTGGLSGGSITLATTELYDPASNTWAFAASMSTFREFHTATLLTSGKVLAVGGLVGTTVQGSAELYDPIGNTWSPAASLTTARYGQTATLLNNGKVLVTGGIGTGGTVLASAELYDPTGNSWSAAGTMAAARSGQTATLLANGKVLVAGGVGAGGTALASAELYDPATNTWSSAGPLANARAYHTATLLSNGNVLVAGGLANGTYLASAELYDSTSNTWSAAGALTTGREYHTATLLTNSQVLVTGGVGTGGTALNSTELYDPVGNTWSSAGGMSSARSQHTATLLASGKVLVAGTASSTPGVPDAELYDPVANSWAPAPLFTNGTGTDLEQFTATLLNSGKLLVAGGSSFAVTQAGAQQYDPVSNTWSAAGTLNAARENDSATLLPSGKVLVAGGMTGVSTVLASAEVYDPVTNTWSSAGAMATARQGQTATLLNNGKVLVVGGSIQGGGATATAELYNPATNSWSSAGIMSTPRSGHTATLLASGKVLIAGGNNGGVLFGQSSAELYDPTTNTWSAAGTLHMGREYQTATLLPSGKVLIAGGNDSSLNTLASAELYNPATNSWSVAGSMANAREHHTATLLTNGKVLVTGGTGPTGTLLSSAELYDPTSNAWSAAGTLTAARYYHTATPLSNGNVLIAGGFIDPAANQATTELYLPGVAPSITSTGAVAFPVNVLDSFTVSTSGGYPAPYVLTESGTLPSNVTFVDQGNGTALLSGTPPTPSAGKFTLTITARNSDNTAAVTQTFTLTVALPPTATTQSVLVGQNTPTAITLTGSDPNTPALPLTYVVIAVPAHGMLSGTAPHLTYTPNAGYTGADSFQFKDNNGAADSTVATITITVAAAPTANGQSLTAKQDTPLNVTLTGSDPNTPALPLVFTVTGSPAHGILTGTTPNLTYTPSAGYFGSDSIQFKDNNGALDSSVATITITVVGTPAANGQALTTNQNAAVSVTLTGSDPNTPSLPLTFAVTANPADGVLSGTAPNLTYTPNAGFFGSDSFQFKDNNGALDSSLATITLTVVGPPTATSRSVNVGLNTATAILLTGSDPNSPARNLTFSVTANPTNGTLSGTAPNLTYSPNPGYLGMDSVQFQDNNGALSSTVATISLTVVAPPTANGQVLTVAQGSLLAVTLTGADPNTPALPLTFTVTGNPTHGILSGTAPNLTYTPSASYFGADSFEFKTSNGVVSSSIATVSITVVGKPTANGQALTTNENTALDVTLTGSDPNSPALPLTFLVTANPMHGVLSGTVPNLSYSPNASYVGSDSFQFKDNNGTLDSNLATVTLTVVGPPTANGQTVYVAENAATTITVTGNDPNTPPRSLSYTVTTLPAHGTLSGSAPAYTYTPSTGFSGADSFQFKVNNGTLDSNVATVAISVLAPLTVAIAPVMPNPLDIAVNSMVITFSGPVSGFTLANLQLQGPGASNLLTGTQSLTSADNISWTLGNLSSLTDPSHRVAGFTLTLNPAGITNALGAALTSGASSSFTEVAPALSLQGTTLTVPGTSGNDIFSYTAGSAPQATLNGITYILDPKVVSTVQFQGNGGSDTATLTAAGTGNTATLMLGGGTLSGRGYAVLVSGVATLTVNASSPNDSAGFSDSSGGSVYIGAPTFSRLTKGTQLTQAQGFAYAAANGTAGDSAYLVQAAGQFLVARQEYSYLRAYANPIPANEVIGFSTVITYGATGNSDPAYLFSYSGKNHFIATPTTVDLITGAVVNEARGFQYVVATSSSGGDGATFADTVGSNTYVGTPGYSYLINGQSKALQEAVGFAFVYAADPSGGNDVATLLDATGKGGLSFLATPSYSLLSAASTILNELVGFPSVTAQVTAGGIDYATLYDAPKVANVFGGGPTDSFLRGGAYYVNAVGFAVVAAYATPGNQDTGYLSDDALGGTLVGQGSSAVLEGPPGYSVALYGFSSVIAYGSTGLNHLSLGAIRYLFSDVGKWM